jgi:hypothetical protein
MTMWIAGQRVRVAKGEAEEKKKRDELKANPAGQPLKGAMPAGPTHRISSLATSEIELPRAFLGCLVQKMPIPLHWWTNSNLRKANDNPHWLPWRELTLESKKILIIETAKAEKILGDADDEFKNLTPGKWREASINFARALHIVSQEVPADAPTGWSNPAIEYEQHVQFFAQVQDFDDTFQIWFKVEKDLRNRVLKGGAFEENVWENKIGVMEAAHSLLADVIASSRSSSPFSSHSSAPPKKRLSTDDGNESAPKRQQRERSSTPGGSFRPPCCIVCAGPHLPAKHDNAVKTFEDGLQLFSTTDGRDVKTA